MYLDTLERWKAGEHPMQELRQRETRTVSNGTEYDFHTAVTFLLIGLGGGLLLHSLLTQQAKTCDDSPQRRDVHKA
jgi:hypothetical protein